MNGWRLTRRTSIKDSAILLDLKKLKRWQHHGNLHTRCLALNGQKPLLHNDTNN